MRLTLHILRKQFRLMPTLVQSFLTRVLWISSSSSILRLTAPAHGPLAVPPPTLASTAMWVWVDNAALAPLPNLCQVFERWSPTQWGCWGVFNMTNLTSQFSFSLFIHHLSFLVYTSVLHVGILSHTLSSQQQDSAKAQFTNIFDMPSCGSDLYYFSSVMSGNWTTANTAEVTTDLRAVIVASAVNK